MQGGQNRKVVTRSEYFWCLSLFPFCIKLAEKKKICQLVISLLVLSIMCLVCSFLSRALFRFRTLLIPAFSIPARGSGDNLCLVLFGPLDHLDIDLLLGFWLDLLCVRHRDGSPSAQVYSGEETWRGVSSKRTTAHCRLQTGFYRTGRTWQGMGNFSIVACPLSLARGGQGSGPRVLLQARKQDVSVTDPWQERTLLGVVKELGLVFCLAQVLGSKIFPWRTHLYCNQTTPQ
jgi:hypothetical protein